MYPNITSFFILFHLGCFFSFSSSSKSKPSLFASFKSFFFSKPIPSSSSTPLNPPDIYPCSLCAEIFPSSTLLHHHHSSNHSISNLTDDNNIIRIIFNTGWPNKPNTRPTIHRILKINHTNTPKIISRFEEYRERVKSSAKDSTDERCIADGNEVLRFYCTSFVCSLQDENSDLCKHQYCSACGIIRKGFSKKIMDAGVSTFSTSWRAERAIPDELNFLHVKRAVIVCRVIAGRVGFDCSVGGVLEDELVVFDPRALLPCFLIVYTV